MNVKEKKYDVSFFHRQVDAKWFMVTAQPLSVGSILVKSLSDLNTVRRI